VSDHGGMARGVRWAALVVALAALVAVAVVIAMATLSPEPPESAESSDLRSATDGTRGDPVRRAPSSVLVIAHRGASAYAPHDTVAAAEEAVARGAEALEVDVRQTRDGHLVALFAPTLAPTTDVEQVYPGRAPWRVESFTLAEIRRLDAGSWFAPRFRGERVPTLDQIVSAVEGSDVRVVVEVKTPGRYPGIAERVVREIRRDSARYLEIECFEAGFLRRLASRNLPVDLGLTGTPTASRLPGVASFADAVNPQASSIDAEYVDRAHRAGLEVKVWSLNTVDSMRRALDLGVDGIYTHRPDVLNGILDEKAR
jgi:glycerophosphoryl diester phosphodiesterase